MTFKFWMAEHADFIFYGFFSLLLFLEVLFRFIFKVKKNNMWLEYIDSGFIAIVLAMIIRLLLIQTFIIPSGSMENSLLIGDQLIVNKCGYGIRLPGVERKWGQWLTPKRGEVIVFRDPRDTKTRLIKRCIGIPGDTVEIKNKVVFINGVAQAEPYRIERDPRILDASYPRDQFGPVVVPAHSYFMLGDNRDCSADSRFWGFAPDRLVEGKALVVYWPLRRWRRIR